MEIRQYFMLFRKWAWLLALGAALGGIASYSFSLTQPVIYQTSTKIMVSAPQDQNTQFYYTAYFDIQLAQTYSQIINTKQVLDLLSKELGYQVSGGQISAKQVTDSQLVVITVTDGDPNRAAEIANTLVDVFKAYSESLQKERYESSEETLQNQIDQIVDQMTTLQTEMSQVTESTLETQKQQIAEQLKDFESQLSSANDELVQLETQLDTFFPTPAVTNTPAPSWNIPTSTPVPVATPTLSIADQIKYRELQTRRDLLNNQRTLYQQAYGNLVLLLQGSTTDPALRQSQLQTTLALYQQIYSNLLTSFENVRLARLRGTPNVVQIEIANVPSRPIQPQPVRNALLGAMSGLIIMGAVAFLMEYLDDTLKTPEDVSQQLHIPVIGLIGEMGYPKGKKQEVEPGIFVIDNPLSPITEGFRNLRTNLEFASVDKPLRTLLVTSPSPSEGKTTIAVNLAGVIVQGERKVALLDADLRRPAVHRYLGIPNRKGLTDLLRNPSDISLEDSTGELITQWGDPSFTVITSGELPPNPTELMASERMEKILNGLKEVVDIVIIDTPPAILSDPIALSAKVDGVLIVIKPGSTKIGAAQVLMEQLQRAGARVVGVALNPISRRGSHYYTKYGYYSSYYYYSHGHGYYYSDDGKKSRKEKVKSGNGKEINKG